MSKTPLLVALLIKVCFATSNTLSPPSLHLVRYFSKTMPAYPVSNFPKLLSLNLLEIAQTGRELAEGVKKSCIKLGSGQFHLFKD